MASGVDMCITVDNTLPQKPIGNKVYQEIGSASGHNVCRGLADVKVDEQKPLSTPNILESQNVKSSEPSQGKEMVGIVMCKIVKNGLQNNKPQDILSDGYKAQTITPPTDPAPSQNWMMPNPRVGQLPNMGIPISPILPQPMLMDGFEKTVAKFVVTDDGKVVFDGQEIMNCAVRIDETQAYENKTVYQCTICINGLMIEKKIRSNKFTKGEWLKDLPGFATGGVGYEKLIYEYLNELVRKSFHTLVERVRKAGWTERNMTLLYITPDGVIGYPNLQIKSEYGQEFGDLTKVTSGTFRPFVEMMRITPNTWVGSIILLYTVMSFSRELYKRAGLLPKFILFLNGPRGSFKTQLALLLTQIERSDSPEYSLKAKSAALEAGFRKYKDAVMLIDDLAPTQELSDRKALQSNLELIVRSYGDATGKKRNYDFMDENFDVEQYEAEGGAIITGEYTTGCESSLSRCLFLPLKREEVDVSLLTRLQNDKRRLSTFMLGFLNYLSRKSGDVISFIHDRGNRYRSNLAGRYSNPRYSEYYAQLMVAAEILCEYGDATNQMEYFNKESLLNVFNESIQQCIEYNDRNLRVEAPISQLCTALIEEIEARMFPVVSLGEKAVDAKNTILENETSFFITQTAALMMRERHMAENGIQGIKYSTTELAGLLCEAGIISKIKEGGVKRYARKISGYGNVRYMEVDKIRLYQAVQSNT